MRTTVSAREGEEAVKQPVQRVCVIGAGAIGSLCAAHLARVADVTVLTRRTDHARALRDDGLRVSGKTAFVSRPNATADPAELGAIDLIVLATKATALEQAASSIEGRLPQAVVMTIQNGLGAEEIVRSHGDWPLISGTTLMGGTRHSDTHVEYELDAATWMGPYAQSGTPLAVVEEVRDLFVTSGLKAEAFPDLLPAQWAKLVFNAAVGGISAVTELPHSPAHARTDHSSDLGHLVRDLIDEGRRIAAAAGIPLHEDPWELNVRAIEAGAAEDGAYAHPPSILLDVWARRPTEIDFNAGALVRAAERLGVEAPLTTALWRLIKAKEAGWRLTR